MSKNAIAISRGLAAAGLDPKAADAVAEAVVTHSDEHLATKADIAELRHETAALDAKVAAQISILAVKIDALDGKFRIIYSLISALFIAIIISALIR